MTSLDRPGTSWGHLPWSGPRSQPIPSRFASGWSSLVWVPPGAGGDVASCRGGDLRTARCARRWSGRVREGSRRAVCALSGSPDLLPGTGARNRTRRRAGALSGPVEQPGRWRSPWRVPAPTGTSVIADRRISLAAYRPGETGRGFTPADSVRRPHPGAGTGTGANRSHGRSGRTRDPGIRPGVTLRPTRSIPTTSPPPDTQRPLWPNCYVNSSLRGTAWPGRPGGHARTPAVHRARIPSRALITCLLSRIHIPISTHSHSFL